MRRGILENERRKLGVFEYDSPRYSDIYSAESRTAEMLLPEASRIHIVDGDIRR